jgi:hypothetical protein
MINDADTTLAVKSAVVGFAIYQLRIAQFSLLSVLTSHSEVFPVLLEV